jgi:predicted DNA-binding transcriptional regulator AlpA
LWQLGQIGEYLEPIAITVHAPDASTADHDARVLTEAASRLESEDARAAVLRLAGALAGTGVVLASPDESVSPRVAGQMLGVSRQLVDRMIKDGQLPATTKPGSAHQLVSVEDIRTLAARREQAHSAVDDLVGGLLADGAEY